MINCGIRITSQFGKGEEYRVMVPCNLRVHQCRCCVTRTFGTVHLMLMGLISLSRFNTCNYLLFQDDFHSHSVYKSKLFEFPLDDLPSGMIFLIFMTY